MGCARTHCMARTAVHIPPGVLAVVEVYAECLRRRDVPDRRPGLVANAARTNIPPANLAPWSVTRKASHMSVRARRHRESYAAAGGPMARRTVCLARVPGVVEGRFETSQPRKSLQSRRRVTDRADRTLVVGELLDVAAAAWNVARKADGGGIVFSNVADQTRHAGMLRTAVLEFREVLSLICRGRFACKFRC